VPRRPWQLATRERTLKMSLHRQTWWDRRTNYMRHSSLHVLVPQSRQNKHKLWLSIYATNNWMISTVHAGFYMPISHFQHQVSSQNDSVVASAAVFHTQQEQQEIYRNHSWIIDKEVLSPPLHTSLYHLHQFQHWNDVYYPIPTSFFYLQQFLGRRRRRQDE
jgi:hypothetical protein